MLGASRQRLPRSVLRGLIFLLLTQLLVWTLFPLIGHHSPPLDVIEMHSWASAPQLGYYKHPPLPAWGIFLSESLFGRHSIALFIPSALSVALSTLAVWPLALRLFGPRRALVALFLQSTVFYYHLYAPDYNHNVAQMPFWAFSVSAFYFAVADGGKRWWFAFGAALGVTALSKYSAAFLPLACVALLAWDAQARRHLNLVNVLVAATGFFLLFGPHLAWLVAHDFAPIHYLNERLGELGLTASWSERFVSYWATQVVVHSVVLGVWLTIRLRPMPAVGVAAGAVPNQRLNDRFLLALGLGPFVATLLVGLSGSYLHPMWGSAMFPISGLLAVRALGPRAGLLATKGWRNAWLGLMLLLGAIYAVKNTQAWHTVTHRYARAAFPGPELARKVDALWRAEQPGRPLRTIAGPTWEAGVSSFFSAYDTRVLLDGDLSITPWITADEITRCGAIVVWDTRLDGLAHLRGHWPTLKVLAPLPLEPDRVGTFERLGYSVALIAPAPGAAICAAR